MLNLGENFGLEPKMQLNNIFKKCTTLIMVIPLCP